MNTEFAIQLDWQSDRRTPIRWVVSHVLRSKLVILIMLIGAFSNAALAAVIPLQAGKAIDAIMKSPPDLGIVGQAAIWIVVSQLVRSVVQFGRNFGN